MVISIIISNSIPTSNLLPTSNIVQIVYRHTARIPTNNTKTNRIGINIIIELKMIISNLVKKDFDRALSIWNGMYKGLLFTLPNNKYSGLPGG